MMRRHFHGGAFDDTLDSAGRIRLPKKLVEHAGLGEGPFVIVGSDDWFEVWSAKRWESYEKEMDAEGPRFKSNNEILAECATVGIAENTPVYLYCFKGARASNTFLALKNAGVKDVRMYFGSWNEWSRDPSLPIEEGLPMEATLTTKAA